MTREQLQATREKVTKAEGLLRDIDTLQASEAKDDLSAFAAKAIECREVPWISLPATILLRVLKLGRATLIAQLERELADLDAPEPPAEVDAPRILPNKIWDESRQPPHCGTVLGTSWHPETGVSWDSAKIGTLEGWQSEMERLNNAKFELVANQDFYGAAAIRDEIDRLKKLKPLTLSEAYTKVMRQGEVAAAEVQAEREELVQATLAGGAE